MKSIWPKIALLVLCCGALGFELWHLRSGSAPVARTPGPAAGSHERDFVLLPADELNLWTKYFGSGTHAEGWEPTLGDMNDAEGALGQIADLSKNDADANRRVDDPRNYYRQYLAVAVDGKRKLFLNAVCSTDQNANWRKRLVIAMDGGKCFWHAVYDPATQRYSDLTVNGRG
ncbi:hypothetical protein [Occallatibacter savannae]|uniref:hypothetical protein n=1 Tax=Occallatibacter savannae TaxID=1002691 RepID=UPI000D686F5F|nr:hypothetical protein [Occallatibacter savannae]